MKFQLLSFTRFGFRAFPSFEAEPFLLIHPLASVKRTAVEYNLNTVLMTSVKMTSVQYSTNTVLMTLVKNSTVAQC